MDEEDGRLGPRARKFGRFDVLTDAIASSLCQIPTIPKFCSSRSYRNHRRSTAPFAYNLNQNQCPRLLSGADLPKASAPPQVEEKQHENVPGK